MSKAVVFLYRLSSCLLRLNIPFLPKIITYAIRLIFGCWIPASVSVGENLILGYGGLGVVIHGKVVLGNNCHVDQGVTIGGTSKKPKVPVIGNDVYIGAGAKILGPVSIGDNVVIGANAVVVKDVPSNSLVVGIPGYVLKQGIWKRDYV